MPLPPQQPLRTERLWLRTMELRDASDVFEYARHPEVLRYTTGITPRELAETEAFLERALGDASTYMWAILKSPDAPVIGSIEVGIAASDSARLDYAIGVSHWGRGLMTEAIRVVTDWCFAAMPALQRIESAVVSENVGSWRVLEKCGFQRVGETTEQWIKHKDPVHLWHYRLSRADGASNQFSV